MLQRAALPGGIACSVHGAAGSEHPAELQPWLVSHGALYPHRHPASGRAALAAGHRARSGVCRGHRRLRRRPQLIHHPRPDVSAGGDRGAWLRGRGRCWCLWRQVFRCWPAATAATAPPVPPHLNLLTSYILGTCPCPQHQDQQRRGGQHHSGRRGQRGAPARDDRGRLQPRRHLGRRGQRRPAGGEGLPCPARSWAGCCWG